MFPCTKCGACCRMVGEIVSNVDKLTDDGILAGLADEIRSFPYRIVEGTCEMYDPELGCKVYNYRPDMCNVEVLYEKYFQKLPGLTKKQYYLHNAAACNQMIDSLGIPEEKKVVFK